MTVTEVLADPPRQVRKFEVGIDIDDVVAQWYDDSHARCVQAGITNGVTPKTWRPYEEYGCTDQEWYDVLNQALLDGYLLEMGACPGALDALRALWLGGHGIHFVTARGFFQQGDLIREHTKIWLDILGIAYDSLTFTQDKGEAAVDLALDVFIDDHIRNYDKVEEAGVNAYLVDRPWNQPPDHRRRVSGLDEFARRVLRAGAVR